MYYLQLVMTMDKKIINMCALNVRGLGDLQKRRKVFNYLKQFNYDLVLLQETHSDEMNEKLWEKQWHGRIFFSHGRTNAKGVCMLINGDCQVKEYYKDNEGRILMLEINNRRYRNIVR